MGDDAGDRLADPARADDYAGGGDPAQRDTPLSPVHPADAERDVDAGVPDDLLSEGSPLRDGLDDAPALDADAGADDDAHRLARRGTTVDVVDDDDDDDADRRPERARRTSRSRSRERERGRSPPRGRSPSNDQRRERAGDARDGGRGARGRGDRDGGRGGRGGRGDHGRGGRGSGRTPAPRDAPPHARDDRRHSGGAGAPHPPRRGSDFSTNPPLPSHGPGPGAAGGHARAHPRGAYDPSFATDARRRSPPRYAHPADDRSRPAALEDAATIFLSRAQVQQLCAAGPDGPAHSAAAAAHASSVPGDPKHALDALRSARGAIVRVGVGGGQYQVAELAGGAIPPASDGPGAGRVQPVFRTLDRAGRVSERPHQLGVVSNTPPSRHEWDAYVDACVVGYKSGTGPPPPLVSDVETVRDTLDWTFRGDNGGAGRLYDMPPPRDGGRGAPPQGWTRGGVAAQGGWDPRDHARDHPGRSPPPTRSGSSRTFAAAARSGSSRTFAAAARSRLRGSPRPGARTWPCRDRGVEEPRRVARSRRARRRTDGGVGSTPLARRAHA